MRILKKFRGVPGLHALSDEADVLTLVSENDRFLAVGFLSNVGYGGGSEERKVFFEIRICVLIDCSDTPYLDPGTGAIEGLIHASGNFEEFRVDCLGHDPVLIGKNLAMRRCIGVPPSRFRQSASGIVHH